MKMLLFKFADEKSLNSVSLLVNSAYRGDSSRKGWTTEADLLDGQRTDPESLYKDIISGKKILLAVDGESLVGSVMLEILSNQSNNKINKYCYLGMLTISPELQNSGLGKKLLSEAESWARSQGCVEMYLSVIPLRKELSAWYERHGYSFTGREQPFPYNDEKFGLPKRNDLSLAEMKKLL
jgi:ribosomal protein S18 acetylase RimI-like enzyme